MTLFISLLTGLLEIFPQKQDKAILTLMVALGAPVKSLSLHKADLRQTIEGAGDMYMKNSSFRMWVKKLLTAYTTAEKVTEDSSFDQRLSNKYQHVIYHILNALGLPAQVEKISSRSLLAGVKGAAKVAADNAAIRTYLMAIADQLGVDDKVSSMPDAVKEEFVIAEDADLAMANITALLVAMGFDLNSTRPLSNQMKQPAFRKTIRTVGASASILRKMEVVTGLIEAQVPKSTTI